jgi:transposase
MAQNFLTCDRDQPMLLPPDLRDWLDDDHLAWFVIDAVSELDLEPFYAAYRADGHGAAAHDPKMMVTLFAYAYAVGERSSRGIERRCREDVAFRVICANQAPDHATIARFRVRHEAALAELFGGVLGLCVKAGIVDVAMLAVDGTKLAADASDGAIRTYEQIAAEILAEAGRIDAAAATSSPRGFAPPTAAAPGFARPRKSSSASELSALSRCRATAPSALRPAAGASPRIGKPSGRRTGATRPTAPAG